MDNTTKFHIQSGGLKRRKHINPATGKHEPKDAFKAICDMLESPGALFEVLTCSSLKGFMFSLTVSPFHSEFIKKDPATNRFTIPETEFIVKFCITSNDEYGIKPYKFKKTDKAISKETETAEGFFEEAKLQQGIWMNSIGAHKRPLCPSVAGFGILSNPIALEFLNKYSAEPTLCRDPKSKYTMEYLQKEIAKVPGGGHNPQFDLGILLMPKVPRSQTLGDYLATVPHQEQLNMKSRLLAKVIRLFVEGKVIHFDLHPGNALVYPDETAAMNIILIDFGRASNLQSARDDDYLSVGEKTVFLELINGAAGARTMNSRYKKSHAAAMGFYNECLQYCSNPRTTGTTGTTVSQEQKAAYISRVVKVIIDVEFDKSHSKFYNPKRPTDYAIDRYQTDWVEELFLPGQTRAGAAGFSIHPQWAEVVFEELCNMVMVNVEHAASCLKLGKNCLTFNRGDTHETFTKRSRHGGGKISKRVKRAKRTKRIKN